MDLKDKKVGIALTGSFCTIDVSFRIIQRLIELEAKVKTIISENVCNLDTKFFKASEIKEKLEALTGYKPITGIPNAEPIGPSKMFDVLAIVPCTGNTIGKLANGIIDTTVTMAAKSHLRNSRPLVIAIATNDGLGGSAKNIGMVMNYKNIYFAPYSQDDPIKKEKSLVFLEDYVIETIKNSLNGKQIQPVIR